MGRENMNIKLVFSVCVLSVLILESSGLRAERVRRDLVCATSGNQACEWFCKGKGYKTGGCTWDTETAAFDCECDRERRGIRCNVGGPNTCHYSCVMMGYRSGNCTSDYRCQCGGGNNRFGDLLSNIAG